jgi:hypothetical protein
MIHKTTRAFSLLAVAALALSGFNPVVQARTLMASAGRAVAPGDYGCFGLWYSSMTNYCSYTTRLEMSLPIDSAGWVSVHVNAYGGSAANNVGCEAVAIDAGLTAVWSYGQMWLPAFGSSQTINTSTYVPGGGGLFMYCDVLPYGRVNTINY